MITGYFMAPVRGKDGDGVDYNVKWDNIRFALEIADWLERSFPKVDWYIPHRHEEFIEALLKEEVSSAIVVNAFVRVAASKDFGVFFDGNGVGEGMRREANGMRACSRPIVSIDTANSITKEQIAQVIASVMAAK